MIPMFHLDFKSLTLLVKSCEFWMCVVFPARGATMLAISFAILCDQVNAADEGSKWGSFLVYFAESVN